MAKCRAADDRTFISPPVKGTIYICERATPKSPRLVWSAMPAFAPVGDSLIDVRRVPLSVRRDARSFVFGVFLT